MEDGAGRTKSWRRESTAECCLLGVAWLLHSWTQQLCNKHEDAILWPPDYPSSGHQEIRILQKSHARKGKSLNKSWTSQRGPHHTHLTTLQGSGTQWLVTPHLDQDCCYTYFLLSTLIFTLLLCGCVKHQTWRPEEALWSAVSVCTFMWVPGLDSAHPACRSHFYLNYLFCLEQSPTTNWKLQVCICPDNKLKLAQPIWLDRI